MQCATIEFARNVAGLAGAHSTEFDPDMPHPVIDIMSDQRGLQKGGTMRLGAYRCALRAGSRSREFYGDEIVNERHRHRYEFNNAYRDKLEKAGLFIGGVNPERDLVEIVELHDHPYFVAVQYHPEFKSKPTRPHPLFRKFIAAAIRHKEETVPNPKNARPRRGRAWPCPSRSTNRDAVMVARRSGAPWFGRPTTRRRDRGRRTPVAPADGTAVRRGRAWPCPRPTNRDAVIRGRPQRITMP